MLKGGLSLLLVTPIIVFKSFDSDSCSLFNFSFFHIYALYLLLQTICSDSTHLFSLLLILELVYTFT